MRDPRSGRPCRREHPARQTEQLELRARYPHRPADPLFTALGVPGWAGYGANLNDEHVGLLRDDEPARTNAHPGMPSKDDRAPLDALAQDGRTTHARLAELTGWSKARVARRRKNLEGSATLIYDVDLLPESLGFHLNATVWLRFPPEHLLTVGAALANTTRSHSSTRSLDHT